MLLSETGEMETGRRRQRWKVPPAPLPPSRRVEGAALLDEMLGADVGSNGLRLELWQLSRDVRLWALAELKERPGLFAEKEEHVPLADESELRNLGLWPSVQTLRQVVADPLGVRPSSISEACTAIARWASQFPCATVAMDFAEIAATVEDSDPEYASSAGRFARYAAEYSRAQLWFDRAIGLGRAGNDQVAIGNALLSWGMMAVQRGELEKAQNLFSRTWRRARKFKLRKLAAAARHNLLGISTDLGLCDEAQEHAAAAQKLYGKTHPRLPYLAHDIAFLWSKQGYFGVACDVFQALLEHIEAPKERVKVLSNLARAAAGARRKAEFLASWDAVMAMSHRPSENLAHSLFALAEGAYVFGWAHRALDIAERACAAAITRGEDSTLARALELIQEIKEGRLRGAEGFEAPYAVLALRTRLLRDLAQRAAEER
jgi:hypothetical protein